MAIHFKKYKRGTVNLLWKHNYRKNQNYSNVNIDIQRSKNNLVYVRPEKTLYKDVKKLIEDNVTGRVNKESVWVIEATIYSPATASMDEKDRFYKDTVEWLQRRFGRCNLVSAVVHFDESRNGRDHMHADICPITEDGRLSAKDMIDQPKLKEIHTELAEFLQSRGHDVQRGEKAKKGKKLKSLTVDEYKERADRVREQLRRGNVEVAEKVLKDEIRRIEQVSHERVR